MNKNAKFTQKYSPYCDTVIIVGLMINHTVETTAGMAGNLGFNTFLVTDAAAAALKKKGINNMENYMLFALSVICLLIIPGPDSTLALTNTLMFGKSGGFKTVIGFCCALILHIIAVVIGLSSLIAHSVYLFHGIKLLGAFYLIYIGVKTVLSMRNKIILEITKKKENDCFRQGFLSNLLNPKVILFFLSFLPQFINTEGNSTIQFLTLGCIHLILMISWYTIYIAVIHRLGNNRTPPIAFNAFTGIVLIIFGIKLVFFH